MYIIGIGTFTCKTTEAAGKKCLHYRILMTQIFILKTQYFSSTE